MNESGSNTYNTARVRSTQKLPMVAVERRVSPRITAIAMQIPVAAERKFCTANPAI